MRRLLTLTLVLILAGPVLFAEDKAVTFKDLQKENRSRLRDAAGPAERAAVMKEYSTKLLALAEKQPGTADAFHALVAVVQLDRGDAPRALALLTKGYADRPDALKLISAIKRRTDEGTLALLEAMVEKQKDKTAQARACQALIELCDGAVKTAKEWRADKDLREAAEERLGKEAVADFLKKADQLGTVGQKYAKLADGKYKETLAALAPPPPPKSGERDNENGKYDLSVGKLAPEIEIDDINGVKTKLTDLRGKVVVLDIWATWCGPCRAMIPHERELVKRLKDKPFVLVSMSADEKKETLVDFVNKNDMPWTHWWAGAKSNILKDWGVEYFPTIYVLDHKGVIRYTDVRGKDMDEAVDTLLKEMAGAKDAPAPEKPKKDKDK
jgi:thiol-disulfide isomerase/thioredoxin